MENNNPVNEVVNAARTMDAEIRSELLGDANLDDFVEIDQTYPNVNPEDEVPPSKEEVAEMHRAFVDRISKQILTHSLFIGLGFEVPTNHALSEAAVLRYIEATEGDIIFREVAPEDPAEAGAFWEFSVSHPGSNYQFLDSDKWLGGLRALHFLATHHDPELVEFITRKTAQASGIDEEWQATYAQR